MPINFLRNLATFVYSLKSSPESIIKVSPCRQFNSSHFRRVVITAKREVTECN